MKFEGISLTHFYLLLFPVITSIISSSKILLPKPLLYNSYCVLAGLFSFHYFSDGFDFLWFFLLLSWALKDYVSSHSVVSLCFFLSFCNSSLSSLITLLGYIGFMAICLAYIFICLVAIFFLVIVFGLPFAFSVPSFLKSIFKWFCLCCILLKLL